MAFKEVRVDVYSHNVKLSEYQPRVKRLLLEFSKTVAQFELVKVGPKRFKRVMTRIYAAATQDRREGYHEPLPYTEFRFHINQFNELMRFLEFEGISKDKMEIVVHDIDPGVAYSFPLADTRDPHDYQPAIIDYLSSDRKIKVLTLQTGKGKTFCTNHAIRRMGRRTLLVVKGMFVQRWIDDLEATFGKVPGLIMVVRGASDLKMLIEMGKQNAITAGVIIITNTTLRNYIHDYEHSNGFKNLDFGYGCLPEDLCQVLGIGVRVIDEAHMDFHLNFKLDLYAHVPSIISLSATLKADDSFTNRMYELAYPKDIRLQGAEYDKYIAVKALTYRFKDIRRIRFKQRGRSSYSHVTLEESIMKYGDIEQRYYEMIADIVQTSYTRVREEGQKMLIFCATVEMCTRLAKFLQRLHPDLKVNRYTAEEPYEVLATSDISVSTLKSAGTAVDIPGLRIALCTVAIGSRQSNEQAVGRLRKNPAFTPEFFYLVCEDIDKHLVYHNHKLEVLGDKVLSHKSMITNYRI